MSLEAVADGVYFLYDNDELVYIGESDNLFRRIGEHIREAKKEFNRFEIYPTKDRIRLESFLIQTFRPKYNISNGATLKASFRDTDAFPNSTTEEAIAKYDEHMGDPYVNEVADEIGTYAGPLLKGLHYGGAPIYRIGDDYWRLDRSWYLSHKDTIFRDFVPHQESAINDNGERVIVEVINGKIFRQIR